MKDRQPPMTFEQIKVFEGAFNQTIKPEATILDEAKMLRGEVGELMDAIHTGDRQEVIGECADIIKFAMSILQRLGVTPEEAVTRKIERNIHKYPMHEVERLVSEGLTHEQALEKLKFQWNRERDKDFYGNT